MENLEGRGGGERRTQKKGGGIFWRGAGVEGGGGVVFCRSGTPLVRMYLLAVSEPFYDGSNKHSGVYDYYAE